VDLDAEARRSGRRLRILVTRLRYLGDVIMTTPVMAALKSRYPGAEIDYLVEERYAAILLNNPHIDDIIPAKRGFIETLRMLRRREFTAALDLFYNPRSAWLLYLAGIPIRVGGSRRWRRRLFTHTFSVPASLRSAVSHHLYPLGIFDVHWEGSMPRVYLAEEELNEAASILERTVGSRSSIIAMHPGGTWPAKRWGVSSFAALARMIRERLGSDLVLVAGPGEREIAEAVRNEAGDGAHVLPSMPVRQIASIIGCCDAVVANDGGIMHLSVALTRPTVGVFGPTEPDIWFPYTDGGPYAVATVGEDCAPCYRHACEDTKCLERLTPDSVYEKLESVLAWHEPKERDRYPISRRSEDWDRS
jgi:heptosyltransferase-3